MEKDKPFKAVFGRKNTKNYVGRAICPQNWAARRFWGDPFPRGKFFRFPENR